MIQPHHLFQEILVHFYTSLVDKMLESLQMEALPDLSFQLRP